TDPTRQSARHCSASSLNGKSAILDLAAADIFPLSGPLQQLPSSMVSLCIRRLLEGMRAPRLPCPADEGRRARDRSGVIFRKLLLSCALHVSLQDRTFRLPIDWRAWSRVTAPAVSSWEGANMTKGRTVLGLALLIGGCILHGPASAQQYRGTAEQQMACTPDVWRFCGSEVPDAGRIVACLQQNTPRLSPGC